MTAPAARPDFVIMGAQIDDQVTLLASRSLRHIEISASNDFGDFGSYSLELAASVRDYVQVFAPTYAQAWQTLFEQWAPTPSQQSRIELETRRSFPPPEN